MIRLSLEGVDETAARSWCRNTAAILDAFESQPAVAPFALPEDAVATIRSLLDEWIGAASAGPVTWCRDFEDVELQLLVVYWFNITQLTADDRDRLGISFSPPEARPFADALAATLGHAMADHPHLADFAARLGSKWEECQPAFADALHEGRREAASRTSG